MDKEIVLANYRSKSEEELRETFKAMSECALVGTWLNFDTSEWVDCAECMVQVIRERDGFGE